MATAWKRLGVSPQDENVYSYWVHESVHGEDECGLLMTAWKQGQLL